MQEAITLQVPTINDDQVDFDRLFELWQKSDGSYKNVRFNFSSCHFLRPNAVAFLGGLARLIESRMGTVFFDWDSLHDAWVKNTMTQNGFAGAFGHPSSSWSGETIPYREDRTEDSAEILDYLTKHWLGRGWVHVSKNLRNAIVGKVWEIYANAFEHSQSGIGVFSCGMHLTTRNTRILSVVDFGQGIAANVRNYLSSDPRATNVTAASCLKWAFQGGTTTRPNGIKRGMGLDLLKEFIRLNHGRLEVYSNDGYAIIDESGERYSNRGTSFEGTILHITLYCDEQYYRFADEAQTDWPF